LFFEQLCQNVPEGIGSEGGGDTRRLVNVVDLLGRKSKSVPGELRLFIYSDGSVEKRIGAE